MPTQTVLDRYLPQTGRTKQKLVPWIVDQGASFHRQSIWFTSSPEEKVGIEQQLHAPPPNILSISSRPIWSKSSGTEICPAIKPSRRICASVGTLRAVTFTRGLPALAIMNDSPFDASSTSFDSWVLAS